MVLGSYNFPLLLNAPNIFLLSLVYYFLVIFTMVNLLFLFYVSIQNLDKGCLLLLQQEQLSKIFELCGYPNEENWPGASKLPLYKTIHPTTPTKRRLRDILKNFDCHAVELIDRMLILNPSQRISAQDALRATYFICYGEETQIFCSLVD